MRTIPGIKKHLTIFWRSIYRYFDIAGTDHAAAFAFYAFFALFPLILLLVSLSSAFLEPDRVTEAIMHSMEPILPLGDKHRESLFAMIETVVNQGGKAGLLGFVGLVWAGLRFFKALVHTQNVAWGCADVPWWNTPAKSFMLLFTLASAIVLGVLAPVVLQTAARVFPGQTEAEIFVLRVANLLIPALVVFYGLLFFFKFCPCTKVRWRDVWIPAIVVSLCLVFARQLLVGVIDATISQLSVVYQTIAVFIALLYGIYISGMIIIYGCCLSATMGEMRKKAEREAASETISEKPKSKLKNHH